VFVWECLRAILEGFYVPVHAHTHHRQGEKKQEKRVKILSLRHELRLVPVSHWSFVF